MQLIDTHQHLIYRDKLGYGWTAGIPQLETGDFTLQDYKRLTDGQGVIGTLFMECDVDDAAYRAEAQLVAGLMRQPGSGILGLIAACRPETDEGFAEWLDEAGDLGIVGFRRVLHVVPDEVSQAETFRANVRRIGQRGLTFDICVAARQLPLARALAEACPDMTLVLDHCGVPDIAGGAMEPWAGEISAIARLPHVHVKLSGISAYCAPGTASAETLRPWVEHVMAAFGPERMLWGGDWPVVDMGKGLPAWLDMTRALLAGLSEAETHAIGQGTARRVYRLAG